MLIQKIRGDVMPKRRVCITEKGDRIGIESIFSINSEGKQINIAGKVEELRQKSRKGELLCECGCGAKLILVAGDRHLVKQHYRLKAGAGKMESDNTFYSKAALKFWLEDNFKVADLETRIPLSRFSGTDRRFELNFYSKSLNLAVCYWNERFDISTEKIEEIEHLMPGRVLYMASHNNIGTDGQYPEYMIKLQAVQGFLAYLKLDNLQPDSVYESARLIIKILAQKYIKSWTELPVIEAKLNEFTLTSSGDLLLTGLPVKSMAENVLNEFLEEQRQIEISAKEKEEELIAMHEAEHRDVLARRIIHQYKYKEEIEYMKSGEYDRALEELKQISIDRAQKELPNEDDHDETTAFLMEWEKVDFDGASRPIRNLLGKRMLKCSSCGVVSDIGDFEIVGQPTPGIGVCKNCGIKKGDSKKPVGRHVINKQIPCPRCGADMEKKITSAGIFLRCSRHPRCNYLTKITENK